MTRRVVPPPFQQGGLDALCGPYCLVNAVRYLRPPLSHVDGTRLLKRILRRLERERPLLWRFTHGTVHSELAVVLREVIGPGHGIHNIRPFKGRRLLTWASYLEELECFLGQTHGIVLISLEGIHDHWTLVRQVTPKSLLLYDSDRLTRISRKTCVLQPSDDHRSRHVIPPSYTYFLWVE